MTETLGIHAAGRFAMSCLGAGQRGSRRHGSRATGVLMDRAEDVTSAWLGDVTG
jgi:hypothetical protein